MKRYSYRYSFAACLVAILSILCINMNGQQTAAPPQVAPTPSADAEIPVAQLLQPEELEAEVGPQFGLTESRIEWHTTPSGGQQQFLYCAFKRV